MPLGFLIGGGAGLLEGIFGGNAADKAAKEQANAATQAAQLQLQMFNQIQGEEKPFVQSGYNAMSALDYLLGLPGASVPGMTTGALGADQVKALFQDRPDVLQAYQQAMSDPSQVAALKAQGVTSPEQFANFWYSNWGGSGQWQPKGGGAGATAGGFGSLAQPFSFDPSQLGKLPGYQFELEQGKEAIQNAAQQAGGIGGNALKALDQYGTGLAQQDYWNQYQAQYQAYTQHQQSLFDMLQTLAGSGQNAAANLGALGTTAAANAGNNITSAGAAQSAGTIGASNAMTGGFNSLINNLTAFLQGGGLGGGGGASPLDNSMQAPQWSV